MLAYILRRLFWFLPVFFVVTALTFWTVRELPGGPFDFAGEKQLPAHVVRNIKRKYGLDKPIWRQYLNYLGDLARLDFGVSFKYRDREVSAVLGLRVLQIQQAKSEFQLRRAADGTLVVEDVGEEKPLPAGKGLELRDGTVLTYSGNQVQVERRRDVALKFDMRVLPLSEGGLAVRTAEGWVPLDEGVEVTLKDGTTVQQAGDRLLVRKEGGPELQLSETSSLLLAVVKADGGKEKLVQQGVGYGIGGDYYVRFAPDRADVLVNHAAIRMNLQPVLVVREGPGKVRLIEEGRTITLTNGALVTQRKGVVTVTASMPADKLLQQSVFEVPVERMLAVNDGRGNLVPLDQGTRVTLPDGTTVLGEGASVVAIKGDVRVEFREMTGAEKGIAVRVGDQYRTLSSQAVEADGLLVLSQGGDIYVLEEELRLPLLRMIVLIGKDGSQERLEPGERYVLPDGTVFLNRDGQVDVRRGRERLTLGWSKVGELSVILQDGSPAELRAGGSVDVDDRTKVALKGTSLVMDRRLDLPVRFTLHLQEDGGWAVTSAGQDQPLPLQEGKAQKLPGDLSVRWKGDRFTGTVRRVIFEAKNGFPISAIVGMLALTIAICMGIPLGIIAALKHNTILDYVATFFAIIGVSVPVMVMGPLLIAIFINGLHLFELKWTGRFSNYILPSFALGIGMSASIARLTRASLLQVIGEDYIRTARAKGLSQRAVIVRHALKNSLIPVVTVLGPMFAAVVTGTLVTEQIFGIPGMGKHFVQSISNRDYPIVMATTIIYAILIVFANLAVDITYGILDPRIRYS
ncbi:MAG: ABC transporter permease subunit [Chloroflexia bacterium]